MSTQILPIPIASASKRTGLELSEAELEVTKKWMTLYSKAENSERFKLLKEKILPQLYLLNKDLPTNAWKERKSVGSE